MAVGTAPEQQNTALCCQVSRMLCHIPDLGSAAMAVCRTGAQCSPALTSRCHQGSSRSRTGHVKQPSVPGAGRADFLTTRFCSSGDLGAPGGTHGSAWCVGVTAMAWLPLVQRHEQNTAGCTSRES